MFLQLCIFKTFIVYYMGQNMGLQCEAHWGEHQNNNIVCNLVSRAQLVIAITARHAALVNIQSESPIIGGAFGKQLGTKQQQRGHKGTRATGRGHWRRRARIAIAATNVSPQCGHV